MAWQDPALAQRYVWPDDDLTVIPDWVYTDEAIYGREVERIFHGPTWNYVAVEGEGAIHRLETNGLRQLLIDLSQSGI